MEENWSLLQSAEQGAGQLLLNSWIPRGVRRWRLFYTATGTQRYVIPFVQVPGWSAELLVFLWVFTGAGLFKECVMTRWAPVGLGGIWMWQLWSAQMRNSSTQMAPGWHQTLEILATGGANASLSLVIRSPQSPLSQLGDTPSQWIPFAKQQARTSGAWGRNMGLAHVFTL